MPPPQQYSSIPRLRASQKWLCRLCCCTSLVIWIILISVVLLSDRITATLNDRYIIRRDLLRLSELVETYDLLGLGCHPHNCDNAEIIGNITQLSAAELEVVIALSNPIMDLKPLSQVLLKNNMEFTFAANALIGESNTVEAAALAHKFYALSESLGDLGLAISLSHTTGRNHLRTIKDRYAGLTALIPKSQEIMSVGEFIRCRIGILESTQRKLQKFQCEIMKEKTEVERAFTIVHKIGPQILRIGGDETAFPFNLSVLFQKAVSIFIRSPMWWKDFIQNPRINDDATWIRRMDLMQKCINALKKVKIMLTLLDSLIAKLLSDIQLTTARNNEIEALYSMEKLISNMNNSLRILDQVAF